MILVLNYNLKNLFSYIILLQIYKIIKYLIKKKKFYLILYLVK